MVLLPLLGVGVEAVRNTLQKPSYGMTSGMVILGLSLVQAPEAKSLPFAGSSSILVFQHLRKHRCGWRAARLQCPESSGTHEGAQGRRGQSDRQPHLTATLSAWQARLPLCSCGSGRYPHYTKPQQPLSKRFSAGRSHGKGRQGREVREVELPLTGTQVKAGLGKCIC